MENTQEFNVNKSLGYLLGRCAKSMGEQLQQRFQASGLEVTMGHWIILAQLWNEDGLSQQEISNRSGVAKPNVTTMVDMLERESFIVRIPDQIDRRINRIFLTQKGKDLRVHAVEQARGVYDTALDGLSQKEIAVLFKALRTVFANLQADGAGAVSCSEKLSDSPKTA